MGRAAVINATAVALVVAGAVAVAGCGRAAQGDSGGRPGAGSRERVRPATPAVLSRSAPATLVHGMLPPVGSSQRVATAGARLTVTLRRVIDPLRGSGARLAVGTHAVGVIFQIRSGGPQLYDSSATGDIRIEVSTGAVTPVLATRGVCRTPLNDFDRYITSGEDRVGCVVFAVADGATLDAVRFFPHAHRLGRLSWAP